MQGRPRVRARLEELRFEIDALSKRIDEHLEKSKQYRSIRGVIGGNSGEAQSDQQRPESTPSETTPPGDC